MIETSVIVVALASLLLGVALGYALARLAARSAHAAHEHGRLQFEQLASTLLEKTSTALEARSHKSLNEVVSPLKQEFHQFRKTVDESFGAHFRTQHTLRDEIQKIVLQANNLTHALKGDVKTQGSWGEVVLERVLEAAGLQKGREYVLQGEAMGLKHVEHGGVLKPDVVVHLPEARYLIIDAKVSLTHYERFMSAEDEATRASQAKQFAQSVRGHINGLAERRYQDAMPGTPDFVLMFMPVEGALMLAMRDESLHHYAWERRVVMVGPSTLHATLRTVAGVWKIEQQNANAQKIAEAGGRLYDKVVGFVADMEDIGVRIGKLSEVYDAAMGKLSAGKNNVLAQAERLRELGVKTQKTLPKERLEEVA